MRLSVVTDDGVDDYYLNLRYRYWDDIFNILRSKLQMKHIILFTFQGHLIFTNMLLYHFENISTLPVPIS